MWYTFDRSCWNLTEICSLLLPFTQHQSVLLNSNRQFLLYFSFHWNMLIVYDLNADLTETWRNLIDLHLDFQLAIHMSITFRWWLQLSFFYIKNWLTSDSHFSVWTEESWGVLNWNVVLSLRYGEISMGFTMCLSI